jgi:glycosyltransferase involved in cell wall biosynthesis
VLWLDVDDLFFFARHSTRLTGIQRLTGELYKALVQLGRERIGFVRHGTAGISEASFKLVAWSSVEKIYIELCMENNAAPAGSGPPANPPTLFHRLKNLVHPPRTPQPETPVDLRDVARPGDILCSLGAPWHHPNYKDAVEAVRRSIPLRFAIMIHDLIPLLCPQFFEAGRAPNFGSFMKDVLPLADVILTNSRATACDVIQWSDRARLTLKARPLPIPVGSGFSRPGAAALPDRLSPGNYVLFVSTIETRKNHWLPFRVWLRLLESLPRDEVPTLVFVGSIGWMVSDLLKAIESTNNLDGKLILLHGVDDATLSGLYEHCRFTLFPSFYEGWGLPVSDSLAFGKVCVASNRTSIPEAGGSFCVYIDPDNTTAAYDTIRALIESPHLLDELTHKIRSAYQPTSWSASAKAVLNVFELEGLAARTA